MMDKLDKTKVSVAELVSSIQGLGVLARHPHYYCDDSYFSCPKAPGGSANDSFAPGTCICGADEHNEEVDFLVARLIAKLRD